MSFLSRSAVPGAVAIALALVGNGCDSRPTLAPAPKTALEIPAADFFTPDANFVERERYSVMGIKGVGDECGFSGRFNDGARIKLKDPATCEFIVAEGTYRTSLGLGTKGMTASRTDSVSGTRLPGSRGRGTRE